MKEKAFVRALRKKLKEGCTPTSCYWDLKIHGGAMQASGVPDLVVVHAGRTIWIECKSLKRPASDLTPILKPKTFTPLQIAMLRRIGGAGGRAVGLVKVGGRLFVMGWRQIIYLQACGKGAPWYTLHGECLHYDWPLEDPVRFVSELSSAPRSPMFN